MKNSHFKHPFLEQHLADSWSSVREISWQVPWRQISWQRSRSPTIIKRKTSIWFGLKKQSVEDLNKSYPILNKASGSKPLKLKQVEANHSDQSTRHLHRPSSLPQGEMLNTGLSNHSKTTKQQEKALAINSGVDRCASAWRKVEKFLTTLPTWSIFLDPT